MNTNFRFFLRKTFFLDKCGGRGGKEQLLWKTEFKIEFSVQRIPEQEAVTKIMVTEVDMTLKIMRSSLHWKNIQRT